MTARIIELVVRDKMQAVALTHGYLVSHLDALVAQIRAIWPRRTLDHAVKRYSKTGEHPTSQELDAVADGLANLDIGRESGESRASAPVLLRFALKSGRHGREFVDYAISHHLGVGALFGDALRAASAFEASHAANLLVYVVDDHPHRREDPLVLLRTMLHDEQQSGYAQHHLGALAASADPAVAATAQQVVLEYVRRLRSGDRIMPEAIAVLEAIATPECVDLLAETLDSDDRAIADAARRALGRLVAGPAGAAGDVSARAARALEDSPAAKPDVKPEPPEAERPPSVNATWPEAVPRDVRSVLDLLAEAIRSQQCIVFLGPGVHAPPPVQSPFR